MDEYGLQRELARLQRDFGIVPELDEEGRLHVTWEQFAALRRQDAERPDFERAPALYGPVEIVVDR